MLCDKGIEKFKTLDTKWSINELSGQIRSTRMFDRDGIILSRFLMGIYDINKDKSHLDVDHENRNPLDNRLCNLRFASTSQNCANKKVRKDNLLQYKGVRFYSNLYIARIMKRGVAIHIGCFKCPIQAALAYDKKARELFKKFAHCNYTIT